MKNYKYDMICATYHNDVINHPQTQMKALGFDVIKHESVLSEDCWLFRVSNNIDNVPSYLRQLEDDFRFSDEQ